MPETFLGLGITASLISFLEILCGTATKHSETKVIG
jgi:hypothetical protein